MPSLLRIAALDTVVGLAFSAKAPRAYVDAATTAWSRCLVDGAGDDQETTRLNVIPPADDADESIRAALQRLSQDVTHHLIAAQTGRLLMFHAGAASHPGTGASVVFVAPSGTGKTTLARHLGRTHGYLTDETAGIDPNTGLLHPYPKPLSVASGDRWRKVETSPDALGLLPAPPYAAVSRLVLLRRAQEATSPRMEELPLLDAVAALIPETSALNRLPRPLQTVADLLARTGPLLRLTYREAADLVPIVADLAGGAT